MTSIRWLGSPTCSAASPTSHRAGFPNCCHGIGNIRTSGWPLELWRPSPTSSRSGVLPRSWAAMKTCYGSCPTSSSPKTRSCGFTISMALSVAAHGSESDDDDGFFAALQELVAYAFEESVRIKKKGRLFPGWHEIPVRSSRGILQEVQSLLQKYRSELVRQSRLLDQRGRA